MNDSSFLDLTVISSGICWTITYIALVYRGFKDKTYGMPFIPLALNISWEITFSIIYPPHSMGKAALIINAIWMICDIGIVFTYFAYGFSDFKRYEISKSEWVFWSIFSFIVSFFIMLYGAQFFSQFSLYFHGDTFEGAKFIAFWQNLVMSISFLIMFWERKTIAGQSFTIAWSKCVGTSLTVGISYLKIDHKGEEISLMSIVITTILIIDVYYMQLIYRRLKKHGINPFLRL